MALKIAISRRARFPRYSKRKTPPRRSRATSQRGIRIPMLSKLANAPSSATAAMKRKRLDTLGHLSHDQSPIPGSDL
jgi:hypothetical protein